MTTEVCEPRLPRTRARRDKLDWRPSSQCLPFEADLCLRNELARVLEHDAFTFDRCVFAEPDSLVVDAAVLQRNQTVLRSGSPDQLCAVLSKHIGVGSL